MKLFLAWAVVVLVCVAGCEAPSMPSLPNMPTFAGGLRKTACLPPDNFVPGWRRVGKERAFRGSKLEEYMGSQAVLYRNYGVDMTYVADYAYEKSELPSLTVEAFQMNNAMAASGIFHHHRGVKLRGQGTPVDVGVEGVRGARVLYFYKDVFFVKVIYSGTDRGPELDTMARYIAGMIPGEARPPRGFEYLSVEGVDIKQSRISQGFTFSYDFLPPSIMAAAPGAGEQAEVFLITHHDEKESAATARDYRYFLERNGLDFALSRGPDRRMSWTANDPNCGQIYATQYKQWVIGVRNAESPRRAEVLVERIIHGMRRK